MTVPQGQIAEDVFAGTGTADPLQIQWAFLDGDDLRVRSETADGAPVDLVRGIDYTVTGGNGAGGTIVPAYAIAVGVSWRVWRATPVGQPAEFDRAAYKPRQHEQSLDRLALVQQEQGIDLNRSMSLPRGEAGFVLPKAADRISRFFGFDLAGSPILLSSLEFALSAKDAIVTVLGPGFKGDPGSGGNVALDVVQLDALPALTHGDQYEVATGGGKGTFVAKSSLLLDAREQAVQAADATADIVRASASVGVVNVRRFDSLAATDFPNAGDALTPGEAHLALQAAIDVGARAFYPARVDRAGLTVERPVRGEDYLSFDLQGRLLNNSASGSGPLQVPFYFGCYHMAFTSPGWTAGTPTPRWAGSFNADGEFVLDAAAGVTAFYDSLAEGDHLIFLAAAAWEDTIGSGGSGGILQVNETLEPFVVAGLPGARTVVPDHPVDREYTQGYLCLARDPVTVDNATAGTHHHIVFGMSVTGPGGIETDGLSNYRNGMFRTVVDIGFHRGKYGIGGNCLIDSVQRYQHFVATEKMADIAAMSRRSLIEFGTGVCLAAAGSGEPPSGFKAGENSRFIEVRGRSLTWKNAVNSAAFSAIRIRDYTVRIGNVEYPGVSDAVLLGTDTPLTLVNGGVSRTNRCRYFLDRVNAPNCRRFITCADGETALIDNEVHGDFFGNPSTGIAALVKGRRTRLRCFFENGHVSLTGAIDADAVLRLGNGAVLGVTDASVKKLVLDGRRIWPGAVYPAPLTDAAASYEPDADAGRIGEDSLAHHVVLGAGVTSFTLGNPSDGMDGERLDVLVHNASGGSVPITLGSSFVEASAVADVTNGSKSLYSFRKVGAAWIETGRLENQVFEGRVLLDESFDNAGYWELPDALAIQSGALEVLATGNNTARVAVPGLRAGSTYAVQLEISGRTAGSVKAKLGELDGGSTFTGSNTRTDVVCGAADEPEYLELSFTGTANVGFKIDRVVVREL